MLRISDSILQSFAVSKQFSSEHAATTINSVDFHHTGELLVSAASDESIHVYDCVAGREAKVLYSRKYGVDLVRFCKQKDSVLSASSNDWDHTLRFLSLKTNQYIRYFKGHRARVTSLALSPLSDAFLSASLDDTVRLWDLRSNACQGVMRRAGRSAVQFDALGVVFAVAAAANTIKLYDPKMFDGGPFAVVELAPQPAPHGGRPTAVQWTDLKFSVDGTLLLANTAHGTVFLFDAFTYQLRHTFANHLRNAHAVPPRLEASFTPDGKYVLCGADDGAILVYSVASGALVTTLAGAHTSPVSALRFNPRFMLMASASTSLALWLPPDTHED
jgi:COMPASS component SWD2